jgi:hypothetical protein
MWKYKIQTHAICFATFLEFNKSTKKCKETIGDLNNYRVNHCYFVKLHLFYEHKNHIGSEGFWLFYVSKRVELAIFFPKGEKEPLYSLQSGSKVAHYRGRAKIIF